MKDYCSAHLLVSEPSEVSKPNFGLAADHHTVSGADFPQFTLFSPFCCQNGLHFYSHPLYR